MTHSVAVDKDLCMSSGRCVADEPAAFRFDRDELAEATPEAGLLTRAQLTGLAENCPSGAITFTV